MSHSHAQSAKPSGWFLLATLLVLLGGAFAVWALRGAQPKQPAEDAARIEERLKARDELEAANDQRLQTYAWTDKEAGAVQIPIEVAMELTVAELQGSQPTAVAPSEPAAPEIEETVETVETTETVETPEGVEAVETSETVETVESPATESSAAPAASPTEP